MFQIAETSPLNVILRHFPGMNGFHIFSVDKNVCPDEDVNGDVDESFSHRNDDA